MIAELLAGASIASSVLGGATMWQQGDAQRQAANQNAYIARRNAGIARAAGREDARMIGVAKERTLGSQRAAYGKAGLAASGSLLSVMQYTESQYALDAKKAIYNSELQAQGLEYDANMMQYQGQVVQRSARVGAVTSVLGGTVQAATAYRVWGPGNGTTGTPTMLAPGQPFQQWQPSIRQGPVMGPGY